MSLLPLPSEIGGVKIPAVSASDLTNAGKLEELATNVAVNAGCHAAGLDGVVDDAQQVHTVLLQGSDAVKSSCTVLSSLAESVSGIQKTMEPVMPLFAAKDDPEGAFQHMSKENFGTCIKVIEEVLKLGDVLDTSGRVLQDVKKALNKLSESAQPLLDKVKNVLQAAADDFAKSLNLDEASLNESLSRNRVTSFFDELSALVEDLRDMSKTLGPVLKAWDEKEVASLVTFGMGRWQDMVATLSKFAPAWEQIQNLYNVCSDLGARSLDRSKASWESFATMIKDVCQNLQTSTPSWLSLDSDPFSGVAAPPPLAVKKVEAKNKGDLLGCVEDASLPFVPQNRRKPLKACCVAIMKAVGGGTRGRRMQEDTNS